MEKEKIDKIIKLGKVFGNIGALLYLIAAIGFLFITIMGYKTNSPTLIMTGGLLYIGTCILFHTVFGYLNRK